MYLKIKQAFDVRTREEIIFSDGELIINDDGNKKSWNVTLANVESGKSLNNAFHDDKQTEMKFISDENKEFQGIIIVTRITSGELGVYFELQGTGPLLGYK